MNSGRTELPGATLRLNVAMKTELWTERGKRSLIDALGPVKKENTIWNNCMAKIFWTQIYFFEFIIVRGNADNMVAIIYF